MKFALLVIVVVVCAAIESEAACAPWNSAGTINVCKTSGKKNCIGVSSGDTCKNLVGGPFVSGFTSGNYRCVVYSTTGCGGTYHSVDKDGWKNFCITPKSIKCPCQ